RSTSDTGMTTTSSFVATLPALGIWVACSLLICVLLIVTSVHRHLRGELEPPCVGGLGSSPSDSNEHAKGCSPKAPSSIRLWYRFRLISARTAAVAGPGGILPRACDSPKLERGSGPI